MVAISTVSPAALAFAVTSDIISWRGLLSTNCASR